MVKKIVPILAVAFMCIWYGIFLIQKKDFCTADLGRHITNGNVILQSHGDKSKLDQVLYTNCYSYTHPDFPCINHHWGAGVIFALCFKWGGFVGTALFYFTLCFMAMLLFFDIARRESNLWIALLTTLLMVPLIAYRREIRPEVFGYLFSGIFLWIITMWERGKISSTWLWILPACAIIWINTHITFFVGLLIIGATLFEKVILYICEMKKYQQSRIKTEKIDNDKKILFMKICILGIVLGIVFAVGFINPFGIDAILYPINIFKNFNYVVLENQSVWHIEKYLGSAPEFLMFKISLVLTAFASFFVFWTNKKRFPLCYFLLALIFGVLAFFGVRHFVLFGFFSIPLVAYSITHTTFFNKPATWPASLIFLFMIVIVTGILWLYSPQYKHRVATFGLGVYDDHAGAIQFLKKNHIQGPMFNDYDLGGYLIYFLYPDQKVYVDNRPEAYPISFFELEYIFPQVEDDIWNHFLSKYNFNYIVFNYHDLTQFGQKFLEIRTSDPAWAPVFMDNFIIIFIRRTEQNASIIKQYKINLIYN
jgi:hypothetical protein